MMLSNDPSLKAVALLFDYYFMVYSIKVTFELVPNVFDCTECFFELTPHEAGYSLAGAFVETSSFGSIFNKGVLKHNKPEMDMTYLQGR